MEQHLQKTRTYFGIAVALLMVAVISGSFSLKYNHIFSLQNMNRITSYYKYRVILAQEESNNLLASVGNILGTEKEVSENPNLYISHDKALSVPVLVYHGIVENPDRFSMTSKTFKEQMLALKDAGYTTITVEEFVDYMNGKIDLPDKSFLLTFDDGRKDSFYGADPILRAVGYNAVMYIATNFSIPVEKDKQSSYYLLQDELKDMINSGRWEIQSHAIQYGGGIVPLNANGTTGNFLSNYMYKSDDARLETLKEYRDRLNDELGSSKKIIENELGNKVLSFSYPFGDYGQQSINNKEKAFTEINKAVSSNYQVAFHQIWPVDHDFSQNHVGDDMFYLKRVEPSPEWSGSELIYWVTIGRVKNLPYNDAFKSNNGWKSAWGEIALDNNKLETYADTNTTGSFTFLDGTYEWKNYIFSSDITWKNGSHVFLASRFKDNDNYLMCTFSDDEIRIDQIDNGVPTRLADVKNKYILQKDSMNLGMVVYEKNTRCLINGNEVLSVDRSSNDLSRGGIGFKTWDQNIGVSGIDVNRVKVSQIKDPILTELANLDKTTLTEKPVDPTKPVDGKPAPKPKPTTKPAEDHFAVLSLPYFKTNPDFIVKDWKNLWGSTIINSEGFRLFSNMNTAGSFAVMPGSKEWTNYFYTAKIDLVKGLSFGLIARETDPNNYLSCTFINYKNGTYYAKLDRVIDSKSETLAKVKLPRYFPLEWNNVAFGMKVNGNDAQCLANGDVVFTANIPTLQSKGGVGFKTWDEMNGNSEINIRTIDIQNIN